MSGFKKAVAAKLAGNSAGQGIIKKHIGDDGVVIIEFFEKFALECTDKSTAKKLKKCVYKIVTKVGVLADEGKIKQEEINKTIPFLVELAKSITDQVGLSMLMLGYDHFTKVWNDISKAFVNLLKGLAREKSAERIRYIESILGNEEYNKKFFESKDEKIVKMREDINDVLERLLKDFENIIKNSK